MRNASCRVERQIEPGILALARLMKLRLHDLSVIDGQVMQPVRSANSIREVDQTPRDLCFIIGRIGTN